MRMLDRYLLRELLVPLFYCLVGFQVFWLAFDLYSHLDDEYRGLSSSHVTQLCLMKLPELLTTVLPVALLLALLYTLSNHARHNELVAMRAAGVGLWRICLPYLAVGIVLGGVMFCVTEFLGPRASARKAELVGSVGVGQTDLAPITIIRDKDEIRAYEDKNDLPESGATQQRIENVRFNHKTGEMKDFIVELTTQDGTRQKFSTRDRDSSRAEWRHDGWMFYRVVRQIYAKDARVHHEEKFLDAVHIETLRLTPDDLRAKVNEEDLRKRFDNENEKKKIGKHLIFTVAELRGFMKAQPNLKPGDPLYAQVNTQLHGRLAQPWVCVVVVLIALPFGAFFGRRNAFVGVAASVVLCLIYFILFRVGLALGTGGKLEPVAAAWLPNAIFAVVGIGLSWRLR